MTRRYIINITIKLITSIFCIVLFSSSLKAQPVDYESIRRIVLKYTGMSYSESKDYPLTALVEEAIKIFDNCPTPVSLNDVHVLYGVGDGNGILDYIIRAKGLQLERNMSIINLSMRRFLGISVWNIDKKISKPELIDGCLKNISFNKIPESDIYFVLGDNFLDELLSFTEFIKDNMQQSTMLTKAKYLIDYMHESEEYLNQDDLNKLQKSETRYKELKKINKQRKIKGLEKVYTAEEINKTISNAYEDKPWFKKGLGTAEMINLIIVDILLDETVDSTEMDLLIGSGGLYYYIAQTVESVEGLNPVKRELMAIVYLLADLINNSRDSFISLDVSYRDNWHIFNNNFGKENLWKQGFVINERTLPERYIQVLQSTKPEINNALLIRNKPLKIK